MKQLEKGEVFQHLSSFLKSRGIEMTEGSYSRKVEQSCSLLTKTINLGQQGLSKAKTGIDEGLDKFRQTIHERTAPKPPPPPAAEAGPVPAPSPAPAPAPAAPVPPATDPAKPARASRPRKPAAPAKPAPKSKPASPRPRA